MNPHELANDIVAIPFLKGLNDRHIRVLAGCACRIHFEKGTIIFHQGETANRFYLIDEGTIELEVALNSQGRKIVAGSIGGGGVLGWSWLFPPYEWQFTARALTQTYALFFYATALREHCETGPIARFRIVQTNGLGNDQAAAICAQTLTGSRVAIFTGRCRACIRKRSVV